MGQDICTMSCFYCAKIAVRFFIAKRQKPDDWTRRASGFLKLLVSLGVGSYSVDSKQKCLALQDFCIAQKPGG